MKKQTIILATTSPYRKEAFRMLDIDFIAEGSQVDEDFEDRPETPAELVTQLAQLKAAEVAKRHNTGIVIGFDSVGWFDGSVLEKPNSREEAFERIKKLSGHMHEFFTGIHMINIDKNIWLTDVVGTEIILRALTEKEINKYFDQDPYYNTYAIGFDPLGHFSASFPISINGSYNNFLRGIPLEKIVAMLKEVGYEI